MKFLAQLQNPPREFTAIPFWFLNGDLTDAERDIIKAGCLINYNKFKAAAE